MAMAILPWSNAADPEQRHVLSQWFGLLVAAGPDGSNKGT